MWWQKNFFEKNRKYIDIYTSICYNSVGTDNTDNTERSEKMQLSFSGKQDVYLEIAERYKEYIKLGIIKKGEKLPSVRALAGELGVNPNTVARAYSILEAEGFVCALPKKGAFVTWGNDSQESEPDKKNVIYALRDMGVSRGSILKWIEEVYGENDQNK